MGEGFDNEMGESLARPFGDMLINEERRQIKDFKIVLKDFEPMVKNPKFLHNGRDISNFSLRPREAWANWLLCVVFRELNGGGITFAEDEKGDGLIIDQKTGGCVAVEHVSALDIPEAEVLPEGEQRVIDAIFLKINKGLDYARDKFLVVFFDGAGIFYRNKIREAVRGKHGFKRIYCIGLLNSDINGYEYAVTEMHNEYSVTFRVKINNDFTDWEVSLIE